MLKNISNLGKTLNKVEQKSISGGRFNISQDDGCHWAAQCLNQWGRCASVMGCGCANSSENHSSCEH